MDDFSIAAIFSDNMVLQRNSCVSFFGEAKGDFCVTVSIFDKKGDILSQNKCFSQNGKWICKLEPLPAQDDCKVTITASNSSTNSDSVPANSSSNPTISIDKTFSNVSIGEVWLAGGQSNMEFELQNCTEGPDEIQNQKDDPNVRFYYTNKIAWKDEHFFEAEKNTCWQTWESEGKKAWSAVGYFFAKKLASDLGCTVGVIGCNWGGTSASAWMNESYLRKDDDLRSYLIEQEEATAGKTIEQQIKEYEDYEKAYNEWDKKYAALWQEKPGISWEQAEKILGKNPWPGPKSCKNPYRPTGLYDCMLSRITPYTLQGVIWYQGESDDHKPQMYAKLFGMMIQNWREDFDNPELPFIFVQLPEHRYEQDKDFKHWCLIREAQLKIHQTVKNAWMTCAVGLGQYSDIHPRAKKELAERMEQNALSNVYKMLPPQNALSPILKDYFAKDGKITLFFENADSGFLVHEDSQTLENYKKLEKIQGNVVPDDFTGFEVAGIDGVYYPAKFALGGTDSQLNTITLCSSKVQNPVFARYGWYNYGPSPIFGKNKLPMSPFRTSTKDGATASQHAEIQQIMTCS